jgi:conjugation system TraG family ATPase
MVKLLNDIFPIMSVEQDAILSRQGDITVAFEVELPEIFTLSANDLEALHQIFIKAIKVLPKHTVLHKQDWLIKTGFNHMEGKDTPFLARCSNRFFEGREYLQHNCYLMLTKKPEGRKPSTSLFSSLVRNNVVPEETLNDSLLQSFLDAASQFRMILEDSGFIQLKRLRNDQLESSKGRVGLIEKYCTLSETSDDRFVKDITFDEGIQVGDYHCRLHTLSDVNDLPSLCGSRTNYEKYSTDKTKFSIGFATALGLLLPCNHIYNQYVFIDNPRQTMRKLESKRLRLQSLSAYSRENAIGREAVNEFLNEAISQQRLAVKAHFNILVWTEDKEQLKEMKNLVSSACAQIDAVAKQETAGAPQIFWAGIPGNAADFPMNDTFDTFAEQATCFFQLETNYRSSKSDIAVKLSDRLTGKPVRVDISDEPMRKGITTNRNKFILGPSGSGKSFFTNHMVRSYYDAGTHVVLVDVGHSYKGLCEMVGGYYFTYDENHPICFNPFYVSGEDVLDTEKKESLKTLLLTLWKKDNEPFRRSEYVAISDLLKLYFERLSENRSITPCFNTFYEFLCNEFVQVLKAQQVQEKDFDVNNLIYVLRPFYKGGEFDYLLNASENLEMLNERFIVFELDNIKDHPILFPVVTIIIMEVFISKLRKLKNVRKMILIEEAWKAIAKEGMAEYIKYLFKTVRKHFGEAVVVTQEVEDIISSPVVKQAIINNSDCKILLDQSKYQNKFDQVQELLGLTEKEKTLVLSVNKANDPMRKYKEVFISLGGVQSKVYRTEVSPEEYLTYTTEQSEKLKVMQYARQFGSMEKGVSVLARELKNKS